MRTLLKTESSQWSEIVTNSNDTVISGSGPGTYQSQKFDRDDLYKVKMVNGWRRPVSYYSNDAREKPITVSYNYQNLAAKGNHQYSGPVYLEIEPGRTYSPMPSKATPSNVVWNTLYFQALKKAKDSVMNLAVTLAELGESIELIRSRSQFLAHLVILGKAGRWNDVFKQLGLKDYSFKTKSKDFASRWMELHFGWMPILADIHNAIDLAGKKARRDGFMVVARATLKTQPYAKQTILRPYVRQSFGKTYPNAYLMYPEDCSAMVYYRGSGGHRVNLWFTVTNSKLQTASALGLTNPASVIWEVTRLSWFADFFLNVGNWLDSLDTLGLTFKGGSKVFWSEQSVEITNITGYRKSMTGGKPSGEYKLSGGGGAWSRHDTDRRTDMTTPGPLTIRNPFDTWKAITTVALVRQQFR